MSENILPSIDGRPPISSLAPPCARCGHSGFVHADGGDHECLYAECLCSDRPGNVRPLRKPARREPRVVRIEPDTDGEVALIARKGPAIVSVRLPSSEVVEHVERLTEGGWLVDITEARPVGAARPGR